MAGFGLFDNKTSFKRIMVALFALILAIITVFVMVLPICNDALAKGGSGFVCMELNSKRVFYGENQDLPLPMASTTKAMTALVVIENARLDDVVTVTKEMVGVEGSSIYLKEGEKITVEELLYGLMLRSGNDSATALAIHVGGSLEKFVDMMNGRAAGMKLCNTHFENPHGLHHENHYTSCYDLAVIACEGMKNPIFKRIVSTKNISFSGETPRSFRNKNKILFNYEGGIGVKTGYTKRAGRCLISASERKGMTVVAVALNCPDMFEKCSALMDRAYSEYELKRFYSKNDKIGSIPVTRGVKNSVDAFVNKDMVYPIKKQGENVDISVELKDSIEAPYNKEDSVGFVNISVDERLIFSEKVYIIEDIIRKKRGIWDYIKELI